MAELFPRESILSDSFTNHNTGNYLRHGINITTNRGCPQHSGETGTRLSSAIHKPLLSRYFLREGDACTQARIYQRDMIQVTFFLFVQRWIFIDAVMPCTSRTFRRLVQNLKEGINSDWQRYSPLTPNAKIAINKMSKNYTTYFLHAFRAKADNVCHVYPVEDCVNLGGSRVRCTQGRKVSAPKAPLTLGSREARSPRNFANLGSQKCHLPRFLRGIFSK